MSTTLETLVIYGELIFFEAVIRTITSIEPPLKMLKYVYFHGTMPHSQNAYNSLLRQITVRPISHLSNTSTSHTVSVFGELNIIHKNDQGTENRSFVSNLIL